MCNKPLLRFNTKSPAWGLLLLYLRQDYYRLNGGSFNLKNIKVGHYYRDFFVPEFYSIKTIAVPVSKKNFWNWCSGYVSENGWLTLLGYQYVYRHNLLDYVQELPCRKCAGCRYDWKNQWSSRCLLESRCHAYSWFCTLTYDIPPIAPDGQVSLRYSDFQLFMKRLRQYFKGSKIRYRVCCEYGTKNGRPHYHVLLFGLPLDDLKFHFSVKNGKKYYQDVKGGQKHYISSFLSSVWTHGFVDVAAVTEGSIRYVNDYMCKEMSPIFYDKSVYISVPGFRQSRGLGMLDVSVYVKNYIANGRFPSVLKLKSYILRCYDDYIKKNFPDEYLIMKSKRLSISKAIIRETDLSHFEFLAQREERMLAARARFSSRRD